MVKLYHSFVLLSAVDALEDVEAMLQVGNVRKHAPALAQTDSTVRASRHQQALQMESNFEKLAAEAVRTGQTPSLGTEALNAVNAALTTLEDELKTEKIANDAAMVGANDQCANCNQQQKAAFDKEVGVEAMKSAVEQARDKHAKCRHTEDPNCGDEKTKCDEQDSYAKQAHGAGPHCPCEAFSTAETQKHCLEQAVVWGTTYNTELGDKITACDGAKEVAEKVAKVCDHDQTTFEMAFCSYEVSLTTTCQIHSTCYEDAVLNRGIVMANLKTKEASEKIMWKSCKKVRCYLDMLDATQVTQEGFNACKQQEDDTGHLDVVYPDAPAKEVCDTTPVTTVPGDKAWDEAEYAKLAPKQSWLKTRNGLEKVTPCPKLNVEPQPKPEPQPQPKPQPVVVPKCTVKMWHDPDESGDKFELEVTPDCKGGAKTDYKNHHACVYNVQKRFGHHVGDNIGDKVESVRTVGDCQVVVLVDDDWGFGNGDNCKINSDNNLVMHGEEARGKLKYDLRKDVCKVVVVAR